MKNQFWLKFCVLSDPVVADARVYEDKSVKLIQGDCLDELRKMPPDSVDIVVTSPPYNIGIKYTDHDDKMGEESYLCWMESIAEQLRRVMKPDGHLFLNVGSTAINPWKSTNVGMQFKKHLVLQNKIVWAKQIPDGKGGTVGNPHPITSERFSTPTNEDIFHFTLTGEENVDRLAIGVKTVSANATSAVKDRGTTWFMEKAVPNKIHPATFPIELPLTCIRFTGKKKGVVLDPFVGSGTTMEAANQCGLRGIGIDVSAEYLEYASPQKVWPPRQMTDSHAPRPLIRLTLFEESDEDSESESDETGSVPHQ